MPYGHMVILLLLIGLVVSLMNIQANKEAQEINSLWRGCSIGTFGYI